MSRRLPPGIARIGEDLEQRAGGYLRNTLHLPGVTCEVCAAPVEGYSRCYACQQHARSGLPIATRVGTLVYAVANRSGASRDQTYAAMAGYKALTPSRAHSQLVRSVAALGVVGHWDCVAVLSDQPILSTTR